MLAVKLISLPTQTGELLPAVGAMGVWLIATNVVPAELVGQPGTVAVTENVPAKAVETPARVGFWTVAVKLFGPVQA